MKNVKKNLVKVGASVTPFLPMVAFAQEFGQINSFIGRITTFINNTLIPLVFGVALLVFVFGMFRFFIWNGHTDDGKKQGKDLMIYATIGFVLMVSIWGLVNLLANGLGFSGQQVQNVPTVPTR